MGEKTVKERVGEWGLNWDLIIKDPTCIERTLRHYKGCLEELKLDEVLSDVRVPEELRKQWSMSFGDWIKRTVTSVNDAITASQGDSSRRERLRGYEGTVREAVSQYKRDLESAKPGLEVVQNELNTLNSYIKQ